MEEKVLYEMRLIETEEGFRMEVKGDKEKLRRRGFGLGPMLRTMGRGHGRRRHARRLHRFGRRRYGRRAHDDMHHEHGPEKGPQPDMPTGA